MAYFAREEYTGDGITTDFAFTAPKLQDEFVIGYVNGIVQTGSMTDPTTFRFDVAPTATLAVVIKRETDNVDPEHNYVDPVYLRDTILNENQTQLLHIAQEYEDNLLVATIPTVPVVGVTGVIVNSVATLKTVALDPNTPARTTSYYNDWAALGKAPVGGAEYMVVTKADHDTIRGTSTVNETGDHTMVNGNVLLLIVEGRFFAAQFGTRADGVTDDIIRLQSAADFAIAAQRKLILNVGTYSITTPLLLMSFVAGVYNFFSIDMEGEKSIYRPHFSRTTSDGARITPTFTTLPGIMIQAGRACRFKNFTVKGLNDVQSLITIDNLFEDMLDNSTFTTVGRDSRYSPYSGICVDPFGTAVPPDGGYPGFSSYYVASAVGSSDFKFESVSVESFIVACMITPNPETQNAEDIYFTECKFAYNKVGLAVGQSQSRVVEWRGGLCSFNLFGFDTVTYGEQQGSSPNIFGCNMSGKYLFNVHLRFGNPLNVHGIHAESFGSIGFLGEFSANSESANFYGCAFHFGLVADTSPTVDFHLYSKNTVNMIGCEIVQGSSNDTIFPLRFYVHNGLNIVGGNMKDQDDEFVFSCVNGSAPAQDRVNFQGLSLNSSTVRGYRENILSSNTNVEVFPASANGGVTPIGAKWNFNHVSWKGKQFFNGDYTPNISISAAITLTATGDGSASFTAPDIGVIRLGDLIMTATTLNLEAPDLTAGLVSNFHVVGVVKAIAGSLVTLVGVCNAITTGTYNLRSTWWRRMHEATTGDTNTSTSITNVDVPTAWKVNQKIMGSGISEGTYITAIVGSTFTLSKATTSSLVGTRLYDVDMYELTGTPV